MRRNKIPLCAFIGIKIGLLGLLFLSLGILVSMDIRGEIHLVQFLIISVLLLSGGGFTISGIGLILKKTWARALSNVVIIILAGFIAVGLYFVIMEMRYRRWDTFFAQLGVISMVVSSIVGLFLVLNNTRIIEELEEQIEIIDD